jgi:enamine deaminase RidA (YjgF/YER057c/UK114 family)
LMKEGGVVGPGDHRIQADKAVENLLAVLARYRAGPADLVKTRVYVVGTRPDLVAVGISWQPVWSHIGLPAPW